MLKKTQLRFLSLFFTVSLLLPAVPGRAESAVQILPPEILSEFNDVLSHALNGLVIFSSSSAMGSGYYTFKESGEPDGTMDVVRLMNDYYLTERGTEPIIPFVRFGVGYLKLEEKIAPPFDLPGENDLWRIRTTSLMAGIGYDLRIAPGLFIAPGFDLIYSHSTSRYFYNNEFSREVLQPLDRDLLGWSVDTFSYNPQIETRYEFTYNRTLFVPSVAYTKMFLRSFNSSSEVLKFNTTSGVLHTKIKAEIPADFKLLGGAAYYRPKVARTDLFGDAKDGLGFGFYHELSFGLLTKNQAVIPVFKDVGLTSGYSFASGIRGWRVGLEAEF